MTRLEGLKDLRMQLSTHKGVVRMLLLECQGGPADLRSFLHPGTHFWEELYFYLVPFTADPVESVLMKLVLNLLQISKVAANHPGGGDVLGTYLL